MALLSRVADRIYWAARYIERAEDSARVLRSFGELLADIPNVDAANWQSLVTIAGSDTEIETNGNGDESQERLVVRFLMSDQEHANSIHQTVESCRSNLRTCREVVPREAWETVNDLTLYVLPSASRSLDRRPIDGPEVVRFLLFDHRSPGRSPGASRRSAHRSCGCRRTTMCFAHSNMLIRNCTNHGPQPMTVRPSTRPWNACRARSPSCTMHSPSVISSSDLSPSRRADRSHSHPHPPTPD